MLSGLQGFLGAVRLDTLVLDREKPKDIQRKIYQKFIDSVQMDAAVLGNRLLEVTQTLSSAQAASLSSAGIARAR